MPQLSLYLTQSNYNTILNEARKAKLSLSKWASQKMLKDLKPSFPVGYEKLCGCFKDDELEAPETLDWNLDVPRESL